MKYRTEDAIMTLATISTRRAQYFHKRSGDLVQMKGRGEGPYIEPLTDPNERKMAADRANAFERAATILKELAEGMTE